jgi:hypothetical protein
MNKLFQWWFTVMPWEQAIFIRKGNQVKLLGAGIYFKIPFIDVIYIQTTRMRMIDLSYQTMSTKDGKTITIKSAVGYGIENVLTLYNTMHHPEMTLGSLVMGYIAEFVRSKNYAELDPVDIEKYANRKMSKIKNGLKDINIKITSYTEARTYRVIQDHTGLWEGLNMEPKK